ncbi:MAG: hypothetical protein ACOX6T_12000 [Myxococcales bacterium]|jgi:tetratricopeptide (TPR) repeat protein
MRLNPWLALAVLVAACAPPAGQTAFGIDEQLDEAEAKDFCDRWMALQGRDSPEAALLRAELALQVPMSVVDVAYCVNREQLKLQAMQDALRASEQLPNNPSSWLVLAAWLQKTQASPERIAEATCRGAQQSAGSPVAWQACGDWRRQANDAQGAVEAWTRAFELSANRGEQCALIQRIRTTSMSPQQALEALPQEVVQQCEARQRRAQKAKRHERW